MAIGRVTSIDLHLDLDHAPSRRAALGDALRDAIRSGRLDAGTRLPSYRALSVDLGIARNTVAEVYSELVSEGWLSARQGSSTSVAHRVQPTTAPESTLDTTHQYLFDLRPGRPDPTAFPRSAWLASTRRAVNNAPVDAFGPGDPRGRIELRTALADYLSRARGVHTDAGRIVVCSGFSQALTLLLSSAITGRIAVESYGLPFHRSILERHIKSAILEVDDNGCVTDGLGESVAVVLTPSHQFPTGVSLSPERRITALEWARRTGSVVIEDDYDGEFRYDRTPVGAMQGLDPDHVLYIGSVSKSLSPAIRLGWMVVPDSLLDLILDAKGERESTASIVDQLTLADLIQSGGYDKHVRRMRLRYRARRDYLTSTLASSSLTGIAAGLQAVLALPDGTEHETLERASNIGLALEGLSTFRHPRSTGPVQDGLVVGFAAPTDHGYESAIDALVSILPCVDLRAG